jgi:uncharacterized membrane protein (UPF0127 family)
MVIKNTRNGKVIAKNFQVYSTTLQKARGLMFSKQKNIIFTFKTPRKVPLHMCFVFYQIDVLYLDENKKIMEIVKNFKPFTFHNPKIDSKYVIELKSGIAEKTDTNKGDILNFTI